METSEIQGLAFIGFLDVEKQQLTNRQKRECSCKSICKILKQVCWNANTDPISCGDLQPGNAQLLTGKK